MATPNLSNNGCITYRLPDGDRTVISWEYVMTQLDPFISELIGILTAENSALDRIITKLESWADDPT